MICRSSRNCKSRALGKEAKGQNKCCRHERGTAGRNSPAKFQNRLQELQQQLAKQKEAALTLQKEAELQEATEKEAALEFAQRQDNLKMRQMMWNAAHHGSPLTAEIMTSSVLNFGVQPGDTLCTPVTLDAEDQTVVPISNAAEAYTVPAAKPSRVAKALQHPEFFQSQTIAGRYQEWIGGGLMAIATQGQ